MHRKYVGQAPVIQSPLVGFMWFRVHGLKFMGEGLCFAFLVERSGFRVNG